MPSSAAAGAEAELAQWQIEVVINHNQVGCLDFVSAHQGSNRLAAEIDEGHRFSQDDFNVGYFTAADLRMALASVCFDRIELGQMIYAAIADIVAVLSINSARVTQTNN